MLILHQPSSAWGAPNMSPFCTKVEAYLRLAEIPYVAKPMDYRTAPRGKVPYINDDGLVLGDSQLIIDYLKKKHGDKLDHALSDEQRAVGRMVRRTLEEGTYWSLVWLRWIDPTGWKVLKPVFRKMLPPALRLVMMPVIQGNLKKNLHAQGTGRHTPEVICQFANDDLSAIATLLGEKPYLLGDEPTSYDCCVYAFLVGLTSFPADNPVKRHLASLPTLQAYVDRFHQRAFKDWTPAHSVT